MQLTKTSLMFILVLQFKACKFTTDISTADRVLNGQDVELVCTHSTNISSTSTVSVNWLENGNRQGTINQDCGVFGSVDTTQYNFTCPSNRNYTWTIKNVQESRNGTIWTCEIAIDLPTYVTSAPATIYVITPITSVSIDGNTNVSADAGSQTTVSCTTSTGRPLSTIRWYFDAGTPSNNSDDEEITSTSEPVFEFGNETTSGSVTITAESNRTGWRIYATANNTESMTPIQSSNAVRLTVTEIQTSTVSSTVISSTSASTGSIPDDCKICIWCKIFPWWCFIIIVIILIIIAGGCTLGYWRYKRIYLFGDPPTWPCSSSKPPDDERSAAASHVGMSGNSSEKSSDVNKGHSGYCRPNETSHEPNLSRTPVHADNQVTDKTKGRTTLPPLKGNAKVEPDGNPEKNTAGQITEVNNIYRALPKPPEKGSEESSQTPNMGAVEAKKPKKKKKKKRKETEKDQIV